MKPTLDAALVDVGGTLWPNSWPLRQADGEGRLARVRAALPELGEVDSASLVHDLITSSRAANGGSTDTPNHIGVEADTLVARCLAHHRLAADAATVARVRRAMALPVADRLQPLPGAVELLAEINTLGMRCVIASNTYWRDAQSYWDDFRLMGMADHVYAIVTSVDAGHLKPHPAVFEMAMRAAESEPQRCVVIGNKEENDIAPALALGMRAILVHPDDPVPTSSQAHAVAPDLWTCALALRVMLGHQ